MSDSQNNSENEEYDSEPELNDLPSNESSKIKLSLPQSKSQEQTEIDNDEEDEEDEEDDDDEEDDEEDEEHEEEKEIPSS